MRKLLAGMLLVALPALASAQFCPSCIQNTAAPQNAIINIGTATIRGSLTASTGTFTYLYATNFTAAQFVGGGVGITGLNASNLGSGTVPSARVAGAYTGITSVGTLGAGVWNGTAIGTQYGGTGQNLVNVGAGSIIYFNGTGTMATLSGGTPEALLQTNGAGAPVWTSSPAVSGQNIYGINPFQLAGGSLPTNVLVSSNSISYVNAASVYGAFGPQVSFSSFTGTIQLSQLSTGTLPTSVVASSITGTGISKGVYGDSSHTLQISFGTDGRASTITVMNMSVPLSDLQSGTLASGILVPAANIQAGVLGGSVVASSVAASGVTPGTYGGPSSIPQFTVGGDGRITSITPISFSGPISGTGTTGFDAIWSSTYQVTNGLLYEHLSQVNVSTNSGVYLYGPTGYIVTQSSIVASAFTGDGYRISDLNPANLNGQVSVSSGGTGQNWGTIAAGGLPYFSGVGALGVLPKSVNGYTLTLSGGVPVWSAASSSATYLAGGTAGAIPYQSAPNVTTFLSATVNGYALQLVAGVPTWVAAVSSATNLAGGAANSIAYQTAANATTFLAQGSGVLQETAGAPGWTTTPTLTGTNISGLVAANILAGTLGPSVIASSVAATAVTAGSYGSASSVPTFTVAGDGRLTAASNTSITITESQVTSLVADLASKVSTGTSVSVSTMIIVQDGATQVAIPNTPIYAVGSPNADWQLAVQNKSNGNNANAGFYALADNGTNSTNGAWFGINGSGYSQSGTWFDGPDDGLAYALSGNMSLGAAASGKIVSVFAGGTLGANVVSVFTSTGMVVFPSGFTVGYNVNKSSFVVAGGSSTAAYQMAAGSFLTTGANGYVTSSSSITTTGGLFGNSLSVGGTTINGSGAISLTASQAITLSGANGNVVSASSVTTTGGLFGASLRVTGQTSGTQCAHFDSSGNLTGTGADCASASGFAAIATGATAGGTARWATATSISTGSFTDNGNTVTAPSGTTLALAQGSVLSSSGTVHISSGATVNFVQTLAFSIGQTSYNASASVTGSTISFTVQGTTVACWLQGSVGASIQSGTYVFAPIVDGGFIKNESASVGATSCQSGTGTETCNPSFYREFQVTGGGTSHTFTLGAWAPSGTGTFPGNFSDAQFGCHEVPSR